MSISKEQERLHSFKMQNISKTPCKSIKKLGNNYLWIVKSYLVENLLVTSPQPTKYNVFIAANKVEVLGLINVEPDIEVEEIV